MSTMGDTSGRLKTIAISVALLVVVGASSLYIASEYGTNRAITVLVAVALIAGLTWLILTIVSIVAATGVRRDRSDGALTNEQRPVPRRAPIMPDAPRATGRRRKNPDA